MKISTSWRVIFRACTLFLFLALAPHASSAQQQKVRATVILPGFKSPILMDSVGQVFKMAASRGAVFHALRAAFDSIGVQTTVADSVSGVIGNMELKLTRRFANESMSKWFDCGIGANGPTANSYRVHVAILGMLTGTGDASTDMRVAIGAGAQAFSGPLGDPIACETRGALEERMHTLVTKALAK